MRLSGAWPFASAILLRTLVQIVFDITVLGLRGASRFIDRALHLLRGAAYCFAGDFLNLARSFLASTLDLIFVDAHNLPPTHIAGERPTRLLTETMLRGAVFTAVGTRSDAASEFYPKRKPQLGLI
jgi:hypothetical protein